MVMEKYVPIAFRCAENPDEKGEVLLSHSCGNCTLHQIDSILSTDAAAYPFGNAIKTTEMMTHIPADMIALGTP